MSKQPLKRIYFDTNILFHWPNLPNNVASLSGVANWVGADLYIPGNSGFLVGSERGFASHPQDLTV